MLDRWSIDFRIAHPDLRNKEVFFKLVLIALFTNTTTVGLEVNHAFLRRLLKQRVQTQQMDLQDLNAHWIAGQVRRGMPREDVANGGGVADAPEPSNHAPVAVVEGSGGRSYTAAGGTNDLKKVGEMYKHRDAQTIDRNARDGASATVRYRQGGLPSGSFGPKPSVVEKQTSRKAVTAIVARAASRALSRHEAMDNLLEGAEHQCNSQLDTLLKQARSLDRELRRREVDEEKKDAEVVAKFSKENTNQVWGQLLRFCPELQPLSARYLPVPIANGAIAFESQASAIASDVSSLANVVSELGGRKTNIKAVVAAEWSKANRLLGSFSDATDKTEHLLDMPESSCWKAGHCLHTPFGKQLHKFRNRVLKALKEEFNTRDKIAERKLLADSMVVICLKGKVAGQTDELASFWGTDEQYYHISSMSFSPFEPMLDRLTEVNESDLDLAAAGPGEVALQVGPLSSIVVSATGSIERGSQTGPKQNNIRCHRCVQGNQLFLGGR